MNWADKGAMQLNKLIPALKKIALQDGANLQLAAQTVHHKCGQSLAIHVLGNHQQGSAALYSRLQDGQESYRLLIFLS